MFHDVRMRGFQQRTEVSAVQAIVARHIQPLSAEPVAIAEAAGRVLAGDVVSEFDVPGFARAAMDGYALRGEETFGASAYNPLEFAVVGEAMPARPFAETVQTGQAVRIMTGAPVPAGANAVLPAEAAEEAEGRLRVREPVPPSRHVGQRGEDIALGRTVLAAGRLLRPQDVGALASIGVAFVAAVRRPSVAILVTGDELLPPGSRPEGFRIVDSNSVMLAALARRDGAASVRTSSVSDLYEAVRDAVRNADAELILISGGSSVGQEDHAPRVVAELGELCVHGVALRPASPTGLGFVGTRPVFLLPGNPVSCLCAYDLFAGAALRRLGGLNPALPYPRHTLPLARKISSVVGRVDYVRVQVRDGKVEPLAISGASVLSSTTKADGFVLVPSELEGHAPGEEVQVFRYDAVPHEN